MRHSVCIAPLAPLALLLLGACLAPRRHVDEWTDIGITQKVDVWAQGRHWRLYGVTVLLDSVTGIPADRSLDCEWCRMGFARSQIDSVVTRRPNEIVKGVAAQAGAIISLMAFMTARSLIP